MVTNNTGVNELMRQWQGSFYLLDALMNRLECKFDTLVITNDTMDLLLAEAIACTSELDSLTRRLAGRNRPSSLRQFYCRLAATLSDWQMNREQSGLRTGCCSLLSDYGVLLTELDAWCKTVTNCVHAPHPHAQTPTVDSNQPHPA